ncbi:MAG TPA: serine/threonine-protein kinase [Blastocatellia bacterium]|nr:serine/threonine-protein kinase [Blastocatellia bacterium]
MNWISDDALERLRADIDLPDLSGTDYSLVRKIAAGGMGTVYLAEDVKLDRRVALKVMKEVDGAGDLAARMLREARILARLEHPSIVPVHDVGTLPDDRVYYVMKFVEGETLDRRAQQATSTSDLLRIFQKICEAVAFAHAHGVLHRDLKPENIMVGPFGEVLVMDWGVAKTANDARDPSELPARTVAVSGSAIDTVDGTVIGTPAYMAPEQARGESVDERADVYALGAILHAILTGNPPTGRPSASRSRHGHNGQGSEVSTMLMPALRAGAQSRLKSVSGQKVPRRIAAICAKALAESPCDRYQTAEAVAADVALYVDGLPVFAYRENIFERGSRWLNQNRFVTILVIAYLVMRVLLLLFTGR